MRKGIAIVVLVIMAMAVSTAQAEDPPSCSQSPPPCGGVGHAGVGVNSTANVGADPRYIVTWQYVGPATKYNVNGRLWFNRRATEYGYRHIIETSAAVGVSGFLCDLVANVYLKIGCKAHMGINTARYVLAVRRAHRDKNCLTIGMSPVAAVREAIGAFVARGGGRCKY